MVKRIAFLATFLVSVSLLSTSCKPEPVEPDENQQSLQKLQAGTWEVDYIDFNTFDNLGNLIETRRIEFGLDTEGGICTFAYGSDNTWTMVDNGEQFQASYTLDARVIDTQGGGTWGIRELTDTKLELALRSEEDYNPCDFSQGGAVYTLTRQVSR